MATHGSRLSVVVVSSTSVVLLVLVAGLGEKFDRKTDGASIQSQVCIELTNTSQSQHSRVGEKIMHDKLFKCYYGSKNSQSVEWA